MEKIVKIIPFYFGEGVKGEIEVLKEFKSHVEMHFDKEKKDLKERALRIESNVALHDENYNNDEEVYGIDDYVFDLKCLYDDILKQGSALLIVGLYRVCELNLNQVLSWRYSKKELKRLTRWDDINKRLLRDGIDIEKISSFYEVDELRLLNNAIKHYGKVSSDLSTRYPKWKVGAEFETIELGTKFDNCSKIVPDFIRDLAIEAIPEEKQD